MPRRPFRHSPATFTVIIVIIVQNMCLIWPAVISKSILVLSALPSSLFCTVTLSGHVLFSHFGINLFNVFRFSVGTSKSTQLFLGLVWVLSNHYVLYNLTNPSISSFLWTHHPEFAALGCNCAGRLLIHPLFLKVTSFSGAIIGLPVVQYQDSFPTPSFIHLCYSCESLL